MKGKSLIIGLMGVYLLLGLAAFSRMPNKNVGQELTDKINLPEMLSFVAKDGRVDTYKADNNSQNNRGMSIGTAEFDGVITPQGRDNGKNQLPTMPNQPARDTDKRTEQPNTIVPNATTPRPAGQDTQDENTTDEQTTPAKDGEGTQPQQRTGETLSNYASEVVRLVNRERAAKGLKALSVDSAVMNAAQVRAREQATSFSHTRPNGQSAFSALDDANASYRGAGENIAMGQTTPAQVMEGWMNSPGHRENILRSSFTKIGVGCFKDASGTYYWAQLFTQ